jgi:hypothetical protein
MSMNGDEKNFEPLRRLLALKRYEQPPPRYFNDFSQQVLGRIRAGDKGQAGTERWFWEVAWLQRLWGTFETNPVLAGAFGAAICALLVSGVIYSETAAPAPVALFAMPGQPTPNDDVAANDSPLAAFQQASLVSSTNGIIPEQPHGSLFDAAQNLYQLRPQKVTWPSPDSGN